MINLNNKNILVVVAHPDDELLGLGGTINKISNETNSKIKVVILGEGITSRDKARDIVKRQNELEIHRENILNAKDILGYDFLSTYDFPDNRFDTVSLLDIVKIVEEEKKSFNPDIVFTHHSGDLNIDHRLTFNSVLTAFRPLEREKCSTIISFETPSGTEWQSFNHFPTFQPNLFIEINDKNLDAKIKAMGCYEFEKRKFPHPRSPKALTALASYRGVSCGYSYAEAFVIIRHLIQN